MNNLVKKLLSLILICAMMVSTSAVAMAAPDEDSTEPIYVEGIEEFFSKNEDGTMSLDVSSAQAAGYTDRSVEFILGNINEINNMVRTQGAYINDDFVATLYFSSTRAKGQSKIEYWATGMVLVYMTDAEADDLYHTIDRLNWVGILLDLVKYLTSAKSIISQACNIGSKFSNIQIGSYKAQIDQVRKNKTGIIMYVAPLPDGIGTSISFGAQ